MKFEEILHLLVSVSEKNTTEELNEELEKFLGKLGFRYYCVFHQPKPIEETQNLIISANWPIEWVQRYVEKKYIVTDPTIRFLIRANRPFAWKEAVESYRGSPYFRRMQAMMADGRDFGLGSGYIFPVFGRAGLIGATTIGGPEEIELLPEEIAILDAAFSALFYRHIALAGYSPPHYVTAGLDMTITHRELQALNYLADGLTSPEIASVLKVSSNTVDWYVTSLQTKLRARNRNHAVAISFRLGLIS